MTDPRYLSRAGKIREGARILGPPEDFIVAITVHEQKLGDRVDLFVKGFCQTLFNEVHSGGRYSPGTPEDTGFAKASWYGGIGGTGVAPAVQEPLTRVPGMLAGEAQAALAQLEGTALSAKAGDEVTMANNAHYIVDLENGTSLQAPEGMTRLAVAAGQLIADEVAAHVMA